MSVRTFPRRALAALCQVLGTGALVLALATPASALAQMAYDAYAKHTAAWMGDSIRDQVPFYGVAATDHAPEVVASSLRAMNYSVKARNFGVGGNTTNQMLGRISQLWWFDIPVIAVIEGGVNDPGAATTVNGSGATTTAVPVQSGKCAALAGGYITIGSDTRLVASCSTDTANLVTALSGAPANTTAVTLATQRNIEAMIDALRAAGVTYVMVDSVHYLNFTSGGDTTSTPYATYAPVQAAQLAAATSRSAAFCDIHEAFRQRIVTGQDAAGSNSWHAFANNQHLNAYGQKLSGQFELACIQAQPGWLGAFGS